MIAMLMIDDVVVVIEVLIVDIGDIRLLLKVSTALLLNY